MPWRGLSSLQSRESSRLCSGRSAPRFCGEPSPPGKAETTLGSAGQSKPRTTARTACALYSPRDITCYDVLVKRGLLARVAIAAGFIATLYAAPDAGYADPQSCAACHAQIAAGYARTGMGRSFYKPSPTNTVEDYRVKNTLLSRGFRHTLRDDRTERQLLSAPLSDGGGRQRNQRRRKADRLRHGVGKSCADLSAPHTARRAAWSFRSPGMRRSGGYWAMNPGYDTPDPTQLAPQDHL